MNKKVLYLGINIVKDKSGHYIVKITVNSNRLLHFGFSCWTNLNIDPTQLSYTSVSSETKGYYSYKYTYSASYEIEDVCPYIVAKIDTLYLRENVEVTVTFSSNAILKSNRKFF